jgi:hypothetical protein
MQFARKLIGVLAIAATAVLAACGGGDEVASLSPSKVAAAAQRADVHATSTVTPAQAAEALLNAAELAYPNLFSSHQTTQTYGPFAFRQYANGYFLGVAILANAGYTQNGIYVVGQGFGTLANPAAGYQGTVTQFLPQLVIDTGLGGNKTLTITVSVLGSSYQVQVLNIPEPTAQADFCSGLANDTTFTQVFAQYGGSYTIHNCTFSGNTGSIQANVTITSPYTYSVDFTITYAYT